MAQTELQAVSAWKMERGRLGIGFPEDPTIRPWVPTEDVLALKAPQGEGTPLELNAATGLIGQFIANVRRQIGGRGPGRPPVYTMEAPGSMTTAWVQARARNFL